MFRHLALVILILPLSRPALAADPATQPSDAVNTLRQALKSKDLDAAMALMPKLTIVDGIDATDYVKQRLKRYIEHLGTGADFIPAGEKVDADCAVIIIKDVKANGRFGYDPFYAVKHDGSWRVMPNLTKYNVPFVTLSADQLKRFSALEKWYDAEEDRLYEKKRKNSK